VDSLCNNLFCQLDGSSTSGAEFAETMLTALFGGSGSSTGQLESLHTRNAKEYPQPSHLSPQTLNPCPEPGTYALLGGGLLMYVVTRRRISTNG
jgi:hypothetical protein